MLSVGPELVEGPESKHPPSLEGCRVSGGVGSPARLVRVGSWEHAPHVQEERMRTIASGDFSDL